MSVEATELEETAATGAGEDVSRGDRHIRSAGQQQQPQDEVDGDRSSGDEGDAEEDADEPSVVVQLAPRVQDGTRCRIGSLDMCIQGKCQVSGGCYGQEFK